MLQSYGNLTVIRFVVCDNNVSQANRKTYLRNAMAQLHYSIALNIMKIDINRFETYLGYARVETIAFWGQIGSPRSR